MGDNNTRAANRQARQAFGRLGAVHRNMVRRGDTSTAADARLERLERDLDRALDGAGPLHRWALGAGKEGS